MILGYFLAALNSIISPVIDALPTATFPIGADTGRTFGQYLGAVDRVVPIVGPLTFLVTMLGAFSALLAFRLVVWAYGLIPGKFT